MGRNPGVTVSLSGHYSLLGDPGAKGTINVNLLGWPEPIKIVCPASFGAWSCSGPTRVGGGVDIFIDLVIDPQSHGVPFVKVAGVENDTAPTLTIGSPLDFQEFLGTDQGAPVTFNGTMSDPAGFGFGKNPVKGFIPPLIWSGNWSAPGFPNQGAATSGDQWVTWNVTIQVPPGLSTITFTCQNIGGNTTLLSWHVKVALASDIFNTSEQDYLHALLKFATEQNVNKDGSSRIVVRDPGRSNPNLVYADLIKAFYQPFTDLIPSSNDSYARKATETLNQIRLAVEVLRHVAGQAPEEARYRQAVYLTLLNQVGTSYDAVRLARSASQADRQALAERLGIRPDHLDALFQDASSISEQTIEQIFGLPDTHRNPLSNGAKLSDVSGSVLQWNFEGINPGRNTDPDGFVYVSLQLQSLTAKVYSDAVRTILVASGVGSGQQPMNVPLASSGNSRLSGNIVVNFAADANDIIIEAAPSLLSWRMERLRALWTAKDFPTSPRLLSVSPNTGQPGQKNLSIGISGQFTHFAQGTTTADLGAGITAVSLTVNSAIAATVILNIDPAAASGARDVILITNLETVTLTNGLVIATAAAPVLTQVNPNTEEAGRLNASVAITGQSTHFAQGTTKANFGAGIKVVSLTVNSATSAIAVLNLDPVAASGARDLTLTTAAEVVTLARGLTVTAATAPTPPIIDPDLLIAPDPLVNPPITGDFRNPNLSDSAYSLFSSRRDIVQAWIKTLQGQRAAGLDKVLGSVLVDSNPVLADANHLQGYTANDIIQLDQSRQQGNDISPYLASLNLTLSAFNYLVKICRIYTSSSQNQLLDSEWNDIYSILVQAQKLGQFAVWRAVESAPAYNVTLSPDWFTVNTAEVELPAWRATAVARQAWQATLQGRINQQQSLTQALQAAVDTTEQAVLPQLRDALVRAIQVSSTEKDSNWLTSRLLIDVGTTGNQKTTRLDQAIDTLQTLFFVLRNEGFQNVPDLSTWSLSRDHSDLFDTEWTWMGTYSGWQASMNLFLFPQNILLPNLREGSLQSPPTQAFKDMLTDVLKFAPLTPELARKIASHYLANLQGTEAPPDLPNELTKILTSGKQPTLSDQIQDSDLQGRATQIQTWWQAYDQQSDAAKREEHLNYLAEIFYFVPLHLALQLQQAGQFTAALDWYHTIYAYRLPVQQRKIWYGLIAEESIATDYVQTPTWLVDSSPLNPHDVVGFSSKVAAPTGGRARAYTRFTLMSLAQCFLGFADSQFTAGSVESTANARNLYLTALNVLASPEFAKMPSGEDKVPENELVTALSRHAQLNLRKIRGGRNIAGMLSQPETGLAAVGGGSLLRPTQYSYQTLIDRAKQLITLAQQAESSFLASLEKGDAESYTDLKAQQDLDVANANVTLQGLMVTEAQASTTLAKEQQGRAQIQANHYNDLINSDILTLEQASIDLQYVEIGLQTAAGILSGAAAANVFSEVLSAGAEGFHSGISSLSSFAAAAGTGASVLTANASLEEKTMDWQSQLNTANQDVLIAGQQITIAQDHGAVVSQQQAIATTQANHAQSTLDFLIKQKFTNAVLYQWMSGILQGVYSYFLQQATTIARLAQSQLVFERQEQPINVIKTDYWQSPSAAAATTATSGSSTSATNTSSSGQPTNTRGLTGAERLLQDIYELDQYAFETNRRKLQITKAISLAQLDPFAFQQFQETGVLRFATPGELFDADFPGHYLRLIQQVRTSVIALIPPIQGIRATLSNTGVSRVTIENEDTFADVVVRYDPQSVALSGALNASGVFQLDPQQGLLLPFQGLGVDTTWEFQLPKAANPIDYSTIADVLLMIDYTAMDSPDYRQQVTQRLGRSFSADRGYSFRQQFADAWYALNNPDQSSPPMIPMTVQFTTQRSDFPPNLDNLQIQQLLLYFVPSDGASFQISVKDLQFTPSGSHNAVDAGSAGPTTGAISTRRGNASNWIQMIVSLTPFGLWQLALPDDPKTSLNDPQSPRNLIKNGQITDILFVLTCSGQTPAWPA